MQKNPLELHTLAHTLVKERQQEAKIHNELQTKHETTIIVLKHSKQLNSLQKTLIYLVFGAFDPEKTQKARA